MFNSELLIDLINHTLEKTPKYESDVIYDFGKSFKHMDHPQWLWYNTWNLIPYETRMLYIKNYHIQSINELDFNRLKDFINSLKNE